MRIGRRGAAAGIAVAVLMSPLLVMPSASGTGTGAAIKAPAVTLPTANAKWDYQIGQPYRPSTGVTVVSRDREAKPFGAGYSICYVNAFQTQPGEVKWWKRHHPNLLLKKAGRYVVDGFWGEILLDTRTAAKRQKLAAIVGRWMAGCATDGFQAVEPDNLDSWTRSKGMLTRQAAFEYVGLLADQAHAAGLAIAQKNAAGATALGKSAGLDFAVAEECGRWRECNAYMDAYQREVFVIEYRLKDFRYSCNRWGDKLSIVLRDLMVTAPGSKNYVYRSC